MTSEPVSESGSEVRTGLSVIDRVMIAIVTVTLLTTCLLISAPHGTKTGYQEWRFESILRSVTELLNFNYSFPTASGSEIKWLTHGLGTAAVVLAAAIMWFTRSRNAQSQPVGEPAESPKPQRHCLSPVALAQTALVLLSLWMVFSTLWSPWGEASMGEAARQVIWTVWALVLGRTLSRSGARGAGLAMTAVLTVTAALGLWYRHERSPFMRLEFPIGNPLFVAACLLAGLALAGAMLFGVFAETMDRSRERKTTIAAEVSGVIRDMGGWWLIAGALIGAAVMAWALRLTESRGAQWALVAGAAAAVWLVSARLIRWLIPLIGIAAVAVLLALNWSALSAGQSGRDATLRFRIYAAKYALRLFAEAPIVGHGQGTYMLLGQAMQSEDMEKDPAAFPAGVLGQAHNEYLQIAAETGLVGVVLCAAFLIMTFRAAVKAWSCATTPLDQWSLAGALAAFTAIAVEELTDVGLRKPGLPAIFYTTVGLTWALSLRLLTTPNVVVRPQTAPARVAGLVVGIVASLGITWSVWRNWQGALASYQIQAHAEEQEWEAALKAAEIASANRLAVEDYVEAYASTAHATRLGAEYYLGLCARNAARLDQNTQNRAAIVNMINEDSGVFDEFARSCERAGQILRHAIPAYPRVAWVLADLLLYRQQMELIKRHAGLPSEARDYRDEARDMLFEELARDPQDLAVVMRLFELGGDLPVMARLDLLRRPLRRGPMPLEPTSDRFAIDRLTDVEPLLGSMMNEEGFNQAMQQLGLGAQQALSVKTAADWSDRYAPESLRLMARANKLMGRFEEAAKLAGQAAELSKPLGAAFPAAVSNAKLDESRYLLLAQKYSEAVAACDVAIKVWPVVRERAIQLRPLEQTRVMYVMASDNEAEARKALSEQLYPQALPAEIDRRLSSGYTDLCQSFSLFPPQSRPPAYERWLRRALELDSTNRTAHSLAVKLAGERQDQAGAIEHIKAIVSLSFAQNDDNAGIYYLRALAGITRDEALISSLVGDLSKRYPGNPILQQLVAAGPAVLMPPATATAPAETSTAPAESSTAPTSGLSPATRPDR